MLDDLTLFIEVIQRGSFAKTAEDLRISPSALSKRIAKLEVRLGTPLLSRSARGVVLTAFGKMVYDDVADVILRVKQKVQAYDSTQLNMLSVLCPQNLVAGPLFTPLSEFQFTHPTLQLRIEPDNRNVLTSQKQFDIAFRVGDQQDSSLIQRKMGSVTVHVVGRNKKLNTSHLFVPYTIKQIPNAEQFNVLASAYDYTHYVGDITLAKQFVASGNGAALLPSTEIQTLIDDKTPELQFHSEQLFTRPIYALWPNSSSPSAQARELIENVHCYCSANPSLCGGALPIG
ncbi:LysR family transcriptional regulator [Alteromonas sp. 38]|uniref:LysR family transcriptional regulator n=1 Tax=Alteromonas TaxID=226 RepID=UPI0012F3A169|nr:MULTISPECIES: LysR family transcriptional regulator [Alteromonas]CAD5264043.1 LysR family transcriptional regulator [Alteromonas sp. 154]VXC17362.1 LysR family transcriptional regulator [Alteromonas sp. 38]